MDERIGLLAAVDFSVMVFSRAQCGFALQIPDCWETRPLRSGKSAAARLREFFLGEMAFKVSVLSSFQLPTILG